MRKICRQIFYDNKLEIELKSSIKLIAIQFFYLHSIYEFNKSSRSYSSLEKGEQRMKFLFLLSPRLCPNRIYICLSRLISLIRFRPHLELVYLGEKNYRRTFGALVYHRSNLLADRGRSETNRREARSPFSFPVPVPVPSSPCATFIPVSTLIRLQLRVSHRS